MQVEMRSSADLRIRWN